MDIESKLREIVEKALHKEQLSIVYISSSLYYRNDIGLSRIVHALLTSEEIEIKERKNVRHGCYCDIETLVNPIPDGCVIDTGDYQDCIYAKEGMKKEDCKYWQPIKED